MGSHKRSRCLSEPCYCVHVDAVVSTTLGMSALPVWSVLAFLDPDVNVWQRVFGRCKWKHKTLGSDGGPVAVLPLYTKLCWARLALRGLQADVSVTDAFSGDGLRRKLAEAKWHVSEVRIDTVIEMQTLMNLLDDEASASGLRRHRCPCNNVMGHGPTAELVLARLLCSFRFDGTEIQSAVADFFTLPTPGLRADGLSRVAEAQSNAIDIPGLPGIRIRLVLEGNKSDQQVDVVDDADCWCLFPRMEWCHDRPPPVSRTRLAVIVTGLRNGVTGKWRFHGVCGVEDNTFELNLICNDDLGARDALDIPIRRAAQDGMGILVRCGVVVSAHSGIGLRAGMRLRMLQRQALAQQVSSWE